MSFIYNPKYLEDFVGNKKAVKIVKNAIDATKKTRNPLSHILISGNYGLGKTALGECISAEITDIIPRITTAPAIHSIQDITSLLTSLVDTQVLILDEVHGLRRDLQELLYEVMSRYRFHFIDPESGMPITVQTPKITIIGTTTDEGKLAPPFLSRFRIKLRLQYYSPVELQKIIMQAALSHKIVIDSNSAFEIAKRSNGTARIALQNLDNVYDYAVNHNTGLIDLKNAQESLELFGIDEMGLSDDHKVVLIALHDVYHGKPVGLNTLAQNVAIGPESVEKMIEPYLIYTGLVERTPRGRQLTGKGRMLVKKIK